MQPFRIFRGGLPYSSICRSQLTRNTHNEILTNNNFSGEAIFHLIQVTQNMSHNGNHFYVEQQLVFLSAGG